MNLKTYEGSHGTSKSRAEKINKQGFILGTGRAGSGIYFWHKSHHYIPLAKGWYSQCCDKHLYDTDENKGCVVIVVELQAPEDAILDMENPEMKDRIAALAEARKIDATKFRRISALYDFFIKRMEVELKSTFAILLIRVAPPDRAYYPEYPISIIGAPLCCVARNNGCITIKKCI
jgi:hypothetical protein